MPKQVDHDARRRALAEAACAVVARDGLDGASLPAVAARAGWSVGSMRHYFAGKEDLLVFAVEHVGARIEERIAAVPADDGPALVTLRAVLLELLPLDTERRDEAMVWLAFVARAGIDPGLAEATSRIWQAINVPFRHRLRDAVTRGELPPGFAVDRQADALHALVDGLVLHLATVPALVDEGRALAVLDGYLATLRSEPGLAGQPSSSASAASACWSMRSGPGTSSGSASEPMSPAW